MVMMLHGCQQDAAGIASVTRLDDVADDKKFVTVYPEQDTAANTYSCWNWFLPADQTRDSGEPAILHGIAAEVMANVSIDPKRVFVTGLSAGGAMAVVMASTWPDVFASTGVVAGCPFKGTPCLQGPSTLPIETLIGYVHDAMAGHARVMPLIVMQGDADTTVPPANAQLLLQQFLGVDDLADDGTANGSVSTTPAHHDTGTASGGDGYDVDTYDFAGASLIESWTVHGMGHAWPGGADGLPYSDPKGPDGSREIYRFLSEHPMP
jgi:poly(hydroxyalkanoate) depolymerase family esterase